VCGQHDYKVSSTAAACRAALMRRLLDNDVLQEMSFCMKATHSIPLEELVRSIE
jgi:hypothetical protein